LKNFLYYISFFIAVCASHVVKAQKEPSIDSVRVVVQKTEKLLEEYKYDEALEVATNALNKAVYYDSGKKQGRIYAVIAKIYEINEDDANALTNYLKAYTYSQISKDKKLEIDLQIKLAELYIKVDKDVAKGLDYYNSSYTSAVLLKDTIRMITPLLRLSDYYSSVSDYKKAYQYLSPANRMVTYTTPNIFKTQVNRLMGLYYANNNDPEKAQEAILKGIHYAVQETTVPNQKSKNVSEAHQELAKLYRIKSNLNYSLKKYKIAYQDNEEYIKNFVLANDIEKEIATKKASVKFEVDVMDAEIKRVKQERAQRKSDTLKWEITRLLGIFLILISLAFLISAYRNNLYKKKLNQDLIEKNKELVTAKETAEQLSQLKSQFISTVSHELRTPLYGVIGLTSLLMEHPDSNKRNEYLESLKFSGDYLLALINDVLQLSKIETKEVRLEKVSFDLDSLVEGIVNSLQSKQKRNNNKVIIDIDKMVNSPLIGDSIRLSQILINLIGNALKFTNDGTIWIKVKFVEYVGESYRLRFSIKDNGIGIPESKQKAIFDNFAQIKNESQEYEGTGLGLAIVRKLIHLHDSEIYIKSEEGKGSEFYFDLVYEKAVKVKNEGEKPSENINIGTTNFNILIVDDNKINQIVTQNILKKKGYTCDIANNGAQGIQMIKKNVYDLILMDINMPEMNGLDATKVIRGFNERVPIIALTAVEEGEVREQALAVGMNDVIVKPYDTQQFFQAIMRNIAKVKLV